MSAVPFLPVGFRAKPAAAPEGYVVRVHRLTDGKWLDAADPNGATWTDAPGSPWPMRKSAAIKNRYTAEIPTPPESWGAHLDLLVQIFQADDADPLVHDPVFEDTLAYYQPIEPEYQGQAYFGFEVRGRRRLA